MTALPVVTGKDHLCAPQRSVEKTCEGVEAGTEVSAVGTAVYVAAVPPVTRPASELHPGPASPLCRAGPPALTRYSTPEDVVVDLVAV